MIAEGLVLLGQLMYSDYMFDFPQLFIFLEINNSSILLFNLYKALIFPKCFDTSLKQLTNEFKLLNIHWLFFTWNPPFRSLHPPAPLGTGNSLPHTCCPGGILLPLSCVETSVARILCLPLFCSFWNSHYSDIGSSVSVLSNMVTSSHL